MSFFYFILRLIAWIPMNVLYPTRFYGRTRFEKKASVFAMNHLSAMDPLVLGSHVTPQLHFITKDELHKRKFVSFLIRSLGSTSVKRGEPDIGATKRALTILKKGKILTIFPEGTRNRTDTNLQEFKNGTALLAIKSKSPMRIFYMWRKPKIFRKNYVFVGEEFYLSQFYDQKINKDLLEQATKIITDQFELVKNSLYDRLRQKGIKVVESVGL